MLTPRSPPALARGRMVARLKGAIVRGTLLAGAVVVMVCCIEVSSLTAAHQASGHVSGRAVADAPLPGSAAVRSEEPAASVSSPLSPLQTANVGTAASARVLCSTQSVRGAQDVESCTSRMDRWGPCREGWEGMVTFSTHLPVGSRVFVPNLFFLRPPRHLPRSRAHRVRNATDVEVDRVHRPERAAMLAALRIVLRLPPRAAEGDRCDD